MRHPFFSLTALTALLAGCATAPRTAATGPDGAPVQLTGGAATLDPPAAAAPARVAEVLARSDRAGEDRALDAPRQTADVLAYLDVSPGMFVAELASGSGYFTELLARSVGANGLVFAENPPSMLLRAGLEEAWTKRLTRPPAARIVRLDSELHVPLAVRGLDLVYLGYEYGGLGEVGVDARTVDASVWNALRPGGRYVIVDRAAPAASARDRGEIEGFGFRLASQGTFLRSPADPSDWPEAKSERVLLTFVRP